MKNFFFLVILCCLLKSNVSAQPIGISISAGIRKTFQLTKKSSIDLRQQFQVNPEIKKYNNKYGDFFNEDGFWPVPDRYEALEDGDDDDLPQGANPVTPNNPGELNDLPYRIKFEWRSNSAVQYTYRFAPWFRGNTGYSLLYDGEEFRHTFRAELDYRPLKHSKTKRKFDLGARALYQYIGAPDDGVYEWQSLVVPRIDADWNFKKNHILQLSNALNGAWDEGKFEFDRWRANLNLIYVYKKSNRFTLSYQFQQRLDKPRQSHGCSLGYEIRF